MQLEDYFEFLTSKDIRIKGTRVGIEHILYEYIHCGQTPVVGCVSCQIVSLSRK